jgi:hypothetical protein
MAEVEARIASAEKVTEPLGEPQKQQLAVASEDLMAFQIHSEAPIQQMKRIPHTMLIEFIVDNEEDFSTAHVRVHQAGEV